MTIYELSLKKQPTQIPKRTGTNYFLGTYFKMTGSLFDGYVKMVCNTKKRKNL
jgi:hypothetical protein